MEEPDTYRKEPIPPKVVQFKDKFDPVNIQNPYYLLESISLGLDFSFNFSSLTLGFPETLSHLY